MVLSIDLNRDESPTTLWLIPLENLVSEVYYYYYYYKYYSAMMMLYARPEYYYYRVQLYHRAESAAGNEERVEIVFSIVENIVAFESEGTCLLFVCFIVLFLALSMTVCFFLWHYNGRWVHIGGSLLRTHKNQGTDNTDTLSPLG